ncbi:hypothetical protein Fmac_026776 [Flemingia macrophylla]|uniref:Uncharacterized protein n=1 Tax=Flemingia macrophylla TaxID=520843 RepID=A0ABD1LG02_9FABA
MLATRPIPEMERLSTLYNVDVGLYMLANKGLLEEIGVYSKVSGEQLPETPTIDVSSKEFYGEGYDDNDQRIPDMTIINKQLGWNLKTSVWDLLESTMTYQHRTYAEAVKKVIAKPVAS